MEEEWKREVRLKEHRKTTATLYKCYYKITKKTFVKKEYIQKQTPLKLEGQVPGTEKILTEPFRMAKKQAALGQQIWNTVWMIGQYQYVISILKKGNSKYFTK